MRVSLYDKLTEVLHFADRYSSNTDKEMLVLKLVDLNGEDLGLIRYSISPFSTLISFTSCLPSPILVSFPNSKERRKRLDM